MLEAPEPVKDIVKTDEEPPAPTDTNPANKTDTAADKTAVAPAPTNTVTTGERKFFEKIETKDNTWAIFAAVAAFALFAGSNRC